MQIERHVQTGDDIPERPVLGQVVIQGGVFRIDLGKAVDQRPDEAEIVYAALHFGAGHIDILQRQGGKAAEPPGVALHPFGQHIVGFHRDFIGPFAVRDRLYGGGVERQDHQFDAVLIHLVDPAAFDIHQAGRKLGPGRRRQESVGILQRVFDGVMLFERDFALHDFLPVGCFQAVPGGRSRE